MKKLGKKNPKYIQGVFNIQNKCKYKGSLPCIYRSSLELKVMRWFDSNPNISAWGSESVVLPYVSPLDKRLHRYFIDFFVHLKESNGNVKKLILEIKPYSQTIAPTISKNKKAKTMLYEQTQWANNQAKWKAADAWAKKSGYTFLVLTEKHINIK